ncbi:MAG: FliH/SctL family protein, partial [Desulfobulbia bacterium]
MSKVLKLQQNREVQSAPSMDTEEFLSFEDFWQVKPGSAEAKRLEKHKSPREIAMEEAAEILRQAGDQAETLRQEAYAEGFAKGEAEGKAAGLAQYEQQREELAALLRALEGEREAVLRQHEESMLALITAMVDRLVYHEISVNPLVIQACLKKAMEFVVENSTVQIHLHGDDFSRLKKASLEDSRLIEGKNRIQLVEDPNIAVGGCFLKTDFGEIDATLENSKTRLYAAVEQAFIAAMAADN